MCHAFVKHQAPEQNTIGKLMSRVALHNMRFLSEGLRTARSRQKRPPSGLQEQPTIPLPRAQVGLLAQRAGYQALDLYGLTSAAQWAAAAAASVRNAAALETAMLRVILGATGIKLVARGPARAAPLRLGRAPTPRACGAAGVGPHAAREAAGHTTRTSDTPLKTATWQHAGLLKEAHAPLPPVSMAQCACHQPRP